MDERAYTKGGKERVGRGRERKKRGIKVDEEIKRERGRGGVQVERAWAGEAGGERERKDKGG